MPRLGRCGVRRSKRSLGALVTWALLALYVFVFVPTPYGAAADFKIREVKLSIARRQAPYVRVLAHPIRQIVSGDGFAAFLSDREVWIKRAGRRIVPLSSLGPLPDRFDWYSWSCAAGNKLVIGVGYYAEATRLAEAQKARGDFRPGPSLTGVVIADVGARRIRYVDEVPLVPPVPDRSERIVPALWSCFSEGKYLYVGGQGETLRLDLGSLAAQIMEEDEGNTRTSIWKEGNVLRVIANEGGASGAWVTKARGKQIFHYAVLNDTGVIPNSILRFGTRLLISCLAGVVEVDEGGRLFTWHKLTDVRKKMPVYDLSAVHGDLYGIHDDGWVRLDLDHQRATHYTLEGQSPNTHVRAVGYFEGIWYVGTDRELVRLR